MTTMQMMMMVIMNILFDM